MMRIAEIAQQCSNSDTSMSGKLCMTQNSYTLSQCRTVCKEMFDLQVSACYMNSNIYVTVHTAARHLLSGCVRA